jgi:regulation of enolase protein 1 (concanavalin A-like superfamily)
MKRSSSALIVALALYTLDGRDTLRAQQPVDPILPQVLLDTNAFPPLTGTSRFVAQGGDLQAALNAAQPGDEVTIEAGRIPFVGTYTLPVQCRTGWIVIRTSNIGGLPIPGVRVNPTAHAAAMPQILAGANNQPAIQTATAQPPNYCVSQYYWLVGLEVGYAPGVTSDGDLVSLGNPSSPEDTPAHLPQFIVIDRSYLHGTDRLNNKRGVDANARSVAVINSHLSNFKHASLQAQAFASWNGPGPFKVVNNYLEGAAENVLIGGSDSSIANMVASDLVFTQNTMKKPLSWKLNDPTYQPPEPPLTGPWLVANLFELKNAQRVWIDGNDFEYSWHGIQQYAITLTPANQYGRNPWSTVRDITFTNNYVRHAAGGVSLLGQGADAESQITTRVTIQNNVFDDISTAWTDGQPTTPASGWPVLVTNAAPAAGQAWMHGGAPDYSTFDHNTMISLSGNPPDANRGADEFISVGNEYPRNPADQIVPNFTFTNNFVPHGLWGVAGQNDSPDGTGPSGGTFAHYFGSTVAFANNGVQGTQDGTPTGPSWSTNYPPGLPGQVVNNLFPRTWADVQFVNFRGGIDGDYHLAPTSPYLTSGTGGTPIGANVDTVNAHQTFGTGHTFPWTSFDVGRVGRLGSATVTSGVLSVQGAGANIWDTADSFQFVTQPLSGDGCITARVNSVQNTNPFAKAGVMMRDGLGAGAAHVILDIRPTGEVEFMQRATAGGITTFLRTASAPPPYWIRLARSGSFITASISTNGAAWTQVGQQTTAFSTSPTIAVGLAVTSADPTQLNTSMFQNVSVLPTAWIDHDIGNVGLPGSATHDGGTFAMLGAGADIWGNADAFHFVHRTLRGDGQIAARVLSQQKLPENWFSKVGVMIRDGDGLDPGARHVVLDIRPTGDVEFMQRASTGGATTFLRTATAPLPSWVRLRRTGATVTADISADGVTWMAVGSTPVTMTAAVEVGLIVTSADVSQRSMVTLADVRVP